jgi:hypothetical protein
MSLGWAEGKSQLQNVASWRDGGVGARGLEQEAWFCFWFRFRERWDVGGDQEGRAWRFEVLSSLCCDVVPGRIATGLNLTIISMRCATYKILYTLNSCDSYRVIVEPSVLHTCKCSSCLVLLPIANLADPALYVLKFVRPGVRQAFIRCYVKPAATPKEPIEEQ